MLINFNKINLIVPVIKINYVLFQICLNTTLYTFKIVCKVLKNHFKYYFKILTIISPIDYPNYFNRFSLIYDFLSIKYNNRLRLKILTNEIVPVYSINSVFISANWWEDESWDMFGIIFLKRKNLIRLLTDYGFKGFPLKKDFPLTGFVDCQYSNITNKICYNFLETSQKFRNFNFTSPWV